MRLAYVGKQSVTELFTFTNGKVLKHSCVA